MRRNKTIALIICLVLVASLGLTGCGAGGGVGDSGEGEQDVYTMKIVNCATPTDPVHMAQEWLKTEIEKRSEGKIVAEIYGNKSISSSDETNVDMVVTGEAHMCTTPTFMLPTLNGNLTDWEIFNTPYMFLNNEELYAYSESEIGEAMREELKQNLDIIGYPITPLGWCKITNSKKPINTMADMKSLKIRVSMTDAYVKTMEAMGANPTPLAWGEVFTAIQQGTVDGLMTSTSLIYTEKFHEAQKYLACIDPFTIPHMPIINQTWYNSLPTELQAVVDDCMVDFVGEFRRLNENADLEAIDLLEQGGLTVKKYTDEERQEFIDACSPLWSKYPDTFGGKEVVDEATKFVEKYRTENPN